MKYGESTFDILYLIFAITTGIIILIKRKDAIGRYMGIAANVTQDSLLHADTRNIPKRQLWQETRETR